MKIKIKKGAGGLKGSRAQINFKDALKQQIFIPSTDKLYFRENIGNEKKYITLHENGILEYNGKFYMQNQNLHLNITDGKIQILNNINKVDDDSILESIPNLQVALGYSKPTKFYNFLFYDDKNLNYYKDKINNVEEEKFVAKRWTSSNGELNLKNIDQNGYGDVLGLNNSILRFFIKKDNDIIKKVILKNSLNWSYKNYKSLVEEINSNQIKYKFRRKRRPNISKQKNKERYEKKKRDKLLLKSDIDEDDDTVEREIELDVSKLEKAGESKQITNDNPDEEEAEQPEQGEQVEAVVEQPEKSQPDEEEAEQPEQGEQPEQSEQGEQVEEVQQSEKDEQVEEATPVDEEDINIEDIPENDNIEGDFDPQEAINIVENDFQLNTFIYLSKKRLKNLTENDFTKAQIFTIPQLNARNLDPNIFKSLKPGIVSNLRYIKLKDHIYDPIKYYLYKPEYWRNNNEAFRYFKGQKEDLIFENISNYKNTDSKESGEDEETGEKKEENIDIVEVSKEPTDKSEVKLNYNPDNDYEILPLDEKNDNDGNCDEILNKYKDAEISVDNPEYNRFQKCIQKSNTSNLKNNENIKGVYPNLDDEKFQEKITAKLEFWENRYMPLEKEDIENIEKKVNELCQNRIFELSPHQLFVKNFLSTQTPYNSILLFHGLGTGKTCSSIQVAEEMRLYLNKMNIDKKIIIVASPVVQENYKLQLFDERKLKKVGDKWDIKSCTGNAIIKEINPIDSSISREKLVKLIKRKIRDGYNFMGYNMFSNFINKIMNKYGIRDNDDERDKKRKAMLIKNEFSNRLIVIDEVQNIRNVKDSDKIKESSNNFLKLVKYADNLKLVLLTATPMFNAPQEIVWLLNLMNINDSRVPINVSDVFDRDGELLIDPVGGDVGKEILERKMRGYISYVKGENVFTFPNPVYPSEYDYQYSIKYWEGIGWKYPKKQMNDREISDKINYLDLSVIPISEYQKKGYDYVINKLKETNPVLAEQNEGIQYTLIDGAIQSLNFIYPSVNLDSNEDFNYRELYGKSGLNRVMESTSSGSKNYEYNDEIMDRYGRIFSPQEVGKYSCKIGEIIETVKKSKGIIIIYSQYIYGGCIPIALALEELGITRYGKNSLFKDKPTEDVDALTMKKKSEMDPGQKFSSAKYAMITGDNRLSPNNKKELKACTDAKNINGETIKIIIISKAGSEGLDFKNVRQVHILDPWYNLFRLEQTIGRAIRNLSHCSLPYTKRNTQIFMYATHLGNSSDLITEEEAIDLYMYRNAEVKGIKIGKITRLLKENAIDCKLNYPQTHLSQSNIFENFLDKTVQQELSTGDIIPDYRIGDKEYSIKCDFMKCDYKCNSGDVTDIDSTTYNEYFIKNNINTIINKIKDLYKKKYLYTKKQLVDEINYSKIYPISQINSALKKLLSDKSEKLVDIIGRQGILKNVNNLYIFNPSEIDIEAKLSNYHIKNPINIRPEKVEINLDNPIEQIREEKIDDSVIKTSLIKYLNKTYDEIYLDFALPITNANYIKSIVITFLKEYSILEDETIKELIIHHIIENLNLEKLKQLIIILNETDYGEAKNVDENSLNYEILRYVYRYYEKYSIIDGEERMYILPKYSKNKNKLSENIILVKVEDNKLVEVEIKSKQELFIIKKLRIKKSDVNENFGFKLLDNRSSVFKIKNWKTGKKNTTGKKCKLFGPKINLINQVNFLYSEITTQETNFYKIKDKTISGILDINLKEEVARARVEKRKLTKEGKKHRNDVFNLIYYFTGKDIKYEQYLNLRPGFLCFQIELLFRFLNIMNINDNKWFFSNVETTIYNLNKFPEKNTISRKFLN